jgi:AcrR family transcriptional regulator
VVSPSPNPNRRSEHSHRAILAAALALVAERGYERTTVDAIARQAGVGKATIYRWWPSKGAVLLEALHDRLQTIGDAPDAGDIEDELRVRINRVWQLLDSTEVGPAYRGLIAAAQSDPDLAQATMEQVIEPAAAAIRQQVARAQQRGELRRDADPHALIDMLNGAIYYRLLFNTDPLDPARIDAILDIAFRGL